MASYAEHHAKEAERILAENREQIGYNFEALIAAAVAHASLAVYYQREEQQGIVREPTRARYLGHAEPIPIGDLFRRSDTDNPQA